MEAFEIRDLTFSYPRQTQKALDRVSLTVEQGEFLVLCGASGSGKSTLLRQMKTVLAPRGTRTGEILFAGQSLDSYDQRQQSQKIGFVQQSPEDQIVTDKVWHELAFGLESLGYDTPVIRRRVAEMASFFGIQGWFYKSMTELSGGQKQLLNLAAVMAMQPSVLILDEPTSQLDPIAAGDFLAILKKINRELGVTVILTEHRLEEALPLADRVAVMDKGHILFVASPKEAGSTLQAMEHAMFLAMPTAMRVWAATPNGGSCCPITVREGRDWLDKFALQHPLEPLLPEPIHPSAGEPVIQARDLWFRYEKDGLDIVKGLSLTVKQGEFLALLGGNGTGKTTAIKLLAGLLKPYRGQVEAKGKIGILPEDPKALFVKKTVREDLRELLDGREVAQAFLDAKVARISTLCRLNDLLERHPYDLSGGEQQRVALAKILLLEPDILLLDEPTKGLDAEFKQTLAQILSALLDQGVTVLMVSHDIEFCARYAHHCALFFDGDIVTQATSRTFFSGNSFYTTAANRMGRELVPQAVTPEDLIVATGGVIPAERRLSQSIPTPPKPAVLDNGKEERRRLPWWRRTIAALSAGVALILLAQFVGIVNLTALMAQAGLANRATQQLVYYGAFCAALMALALAVTRSSTRPGAPLQAPAKREKLPRRTVMSAAIMILLVPATVLIGQIYLSGEKYYLIMLLVLLECMIPFFLVFEGRKPQARELVIIAVLCAIGVAGRAVFIILPQFKPMVALTIVAGVALGGETGFLVGAVTMLASNALLRQGPWTPWQMFAAGIIGFLAGALFRMGWLRRTRLSLCCFGAITTLVCYGGIMNFQSALQGSPGVLTPGVILSYYVTGFPMDCIHAAATWIFLWFGGEAMLEKLDRVKVKYDLMK